VPGQFTDVFIGEDIEWDETLLRLHLASTTDNKDIADNGKMDTAEVLTSTTGERANANAEAAFATHR
jgi:hypothetical protein